MGAVGGASRSAAQRVVVSTARRRPYQPPAGRVLLTGYRHETPRRWSVGGGGRAPRSSGRATAQRRHRHHHVHHHILLFRLLLLLPPFRFHGRVRRRRRRLRPHRKGPLRNSRAYRVRVGARAGAGVVARKRRPGGRGASGIICFRWMLCIRRGGSSVFPVVLEGREDFVSR